jgi:hypothetical protein
MYIAHLAGFHGGQATYTGESYHAALAATSCGGSDCCCGGGFVAVVGPGGAEWPVLDVGLPSAVFAPAGRGREPTPGEIEHAATCGLGYAKAIGA